MYCSTCGVAIVPASRFCRECGAALNVHDGNNVSTGGGDVHGGLYQAGRDVVVNLQDTASPVATYESVPKWRSPATQGFLGWAEFIVGVLGLFPFWKVFEPILSPSSRPANGFRVPGDSSIAQGDKANFPYLLACIALVILVGLFIVIFGLHKIAEFQLRKPLIPGWAISGAGKRITLEKIEVSKCPTCGGAMCYYNRPMEDIKYIDANGNVRSKVTKRHAALECKRNRDHYWIVDSAEPVESR